ncbi:MAG: SIMPL domain-containing protein [Bacteroidales bacterium]|nr:SIMPL domain-containing protein [Bacteroidales bacterium]
MKFFFILPFVLCIFFASVGLAQITTQSNEVLPVVELTGTAEREVIPDEIFIHITIKERFLVS